MGLRHAPAAASKERSWRPSPPSNRYTSRGPARPGNKLFGGTHYGSNGNAPACAGRSRPRPSLADSRIPPHARRGVSFHDIRRPNEGTSSQAESGQATVKTTRHHPHSPSRMIGPRRYARSAGVRRQAARRSSWRRYGRPRPAWGRERPGGRQPRRRSAGRPWCR